MKNEDSSPKIGAGHAAAMARLGLRELRSAMYPDSNVAQPAELGVYGTATPHEVHQSRQGAGMDRNEAANERDVAQDSVLEARMDQARTQEMDDRDSHELERD